MGTRTTPVRSGPIGEGTRLGKLLLVDDSLEDLTNYATALAEIGYGVRCAGSYLEGTAWLDHEQYDLVVVSQGGAGFEGRLVLCHAIERDRQTPVLVLTRHADISNYIEAMQLGAFDYVEKPLDVSEFADLISKHTRHQGQVLVA